MRERERDEREMGGGELRGGGERERERDGRTDRETNRERR